MAFMSLQSLGITLGLKFYSIRVSLILLFFFVFGFLIFVYHFEFLFRIVLPISETLISYYNFVSMFLEFNSKRCYIKHLNVFKCFKHQLVFCLSAHLQNKCP